MGGKSEKNAVVVPRGSEKQRAVFSLRGHIQRTLIPAIVYTQQKRDHGISLARPSLWERFLGWMRYYSIQWRWDIERKLARLLHRNWIG